MHENMESKTVEQLLAEADELIAKIGSDAVDDMREDHRLQFEKHAQHLKKIKSDLQGEIENKATSETDSGAEGMHEAILDIVKAMHELKNKLF